VTDGLVRRSRADHSAIYNLTEIGSAARASLDALGHWGYTLGPVASSDLVTTARSLAMPLQAITGMVLAHTDDPEDWNIELQIDDEYLEVVLGPKPTVTARPTIEPDSRAQTTIAALSAYMLESTFDQSTVKHVWGKERATAALAGLLESAVSTILV